MRLMRTICLLTLLLVNLVPATLLAAQASSQIYGPVSPKETLSEIAQRARGNWRIPLKYVVQAMYELNPHAFTDNDINRLHIGSLLIIPDMKALSEEVPELLPSVPEAPPASKIQTVTTGVAVDKQPEQLPQLQAQHIADIDNLLDSNRNIIASLQKLIGQINGFQQGTEDLQRQISEIKQQLKQVQSQQPRQAQLQAAPQADNQQQITEIRQQLQQQIEEVKTQLQLAMNKMQLLQRQQAQTDQQSQSSTASQNAEIQSQIDQISGQLQALQQQQDQAAQPQSIPVVETLKQQITDIAQQLQQVKDQQNQVPALQAQPVTEPGELGELRQNIEVVSEQLQRLQEQQTQARALPETEGLQHQISEIAQQLQLVGDQIKQLQDQQSPPQAAPQTANAGQAATTLPPWINKHLQDNGLSEAQLYLILSGIAILLALIAIVVSVKASRAMPTLVTVTPTQPDLQTAQREEDSISADPGVGAPAMQTPATDMAQTDTTQLLNEPGPVETTLETSPVEAPRFPEPDHVPAAESEQPAQAESEHVETTMETAPLEMPADAEPVAGTGITASAEPPAEPEKDAAGADSDSSEQLTEDDIDSKLSWAYLHLDMGDVEQASITLDEIDLMQFPQFTDKVQEIRKLLTMYESNLSSEEKMHQETTVDWDLELVTEIQPEPEDTDSGVVDMTPEVVDEAATAERSEPALELETSPEPDQAVEPPSEAAAEIPAPSDADHEPAIETEADTIAEPALEDAIDTESTQTPDAPSLELDTPVETTQQTEPALELDAGTKHELEFELPAEAGPADEEALEFELPDELEADAEPDQLDADTDLGFEIETPELELPAVNELGLESDQTGETTPAADPGLTPQDTPPASTLEFELEENAAPEPPAKPGPKAAESTSGKTTDSKFDNTMTDMHTLLETSPSDALQRVLQQQIKLANTYYGKDEFKKAKTYIAKILKSGTPEYRGKALSLLNLVELKQAKESKSRATAKPPEKEFDSDSTVMLNPQSLPTGQSADETEIPLEITGYHELIPKNLSTRFSEYAGNDQGTSLALAYLFLDIDDPKSASELLEEVTRGSDKSLTNKAHKILEELFVS